MKVKVHCNIRNRTLSITPLEGSARDRVVASAERVLIGGAEFRVSDAGRERVRKTGRKNVHAFVIGNLVATWGTTVRGDPDNDTRLALSGQKAGFTPWDGGTPLTYDPRKHEGFVKKRGGTRVVTSAAMVLLDACTVEANQPVYGV